MERQSFNVVCIFDPPHGAQARRSIGGRSAGFSLVELAIVTVIIGLLMAFIMPTTTTLLTGQKRKTTTEKMANIESALTNYVMVNKRLPCPANGLLNTGLEARDMPGGDCTGNQASGVVPWVSLGMTMADSLDGWDNRITYRVGFGLTRDNALDMSACDPAGTRDVTPTPTTPISLGRCDAATCTGVFSAANCTAPINFLAQKGLSVSDGATTIMNYSAAAGVVPTGAAYVLISHGQNGYGAINNGGTYQANASSGVAGTTLEDANRNRVGLTVSNAAPPIFIDATYSDAGDATTYFDDIVVRPTLMSLVIKAQLGPRSH